MNPEEKAEWEQMIAAAKTPQQKAELFKKISERFDAALDAKGLTDAEREALVAEIMAED